MRRLSNSVFRQNGTFQRHKVRAYIIALPPKPETRREERKPPGNQTGIIHVQGIDRHGERKAEDDDESHDVET